MKNGRTSIPRMINPPFPFFSLLRPKEEEEILIHGSLNPPPHSALAPWEIPLPFRPNSITFSMQKRGIDQQLSISREKRRRDELLFFACLPGGREKGFFGKTFLDIIEEYGKKGKM